MLDTTIQDQVQEVLDRLGGALERGDVDGALACFQDTCFWRDLLTFTWNIETMEGKAEIREMLEAQLDATKPTAWRVAEGELPAEEGGVVTAWIAFETGVARGYGLVRLRDGLIWTLLTSMTELKGHEEPLGYERPLGAKHGAGKNRPSWKEEREREAAELGHVTQPHTVIVGGGQGGIALAARLRQLGVPTIVIERNERPGDSWRNRYKSLCLHDPVWYDHLPYLPFPPNWPVFSPKDKIGDWLEMYARVMELNYWGGTTAKSASHDGRREWTLVVERGGEEITLRPEHLVLATGMSGKPNLPVFPGMERFRGEQHHSCEHPGPEGWTGKRTVVIGSNNSAHDICAALWEADAHVTMVQRSTHPHRALGLADGGGAGAALLRGGGGGRRDDAEGGHDLRLDPLPDPARVPDPHLRGDEAAATRPSTRGWSARASGSTGARTSSGLFMKYLRRGSGYYIDIGASQLVIDGEIELARRSSEARSWRTAWCSRTARTCRPTSSSTPRATAR